MQKNSRRNDAGDEEMYRKVGSLSKSYTYFNAVARGFTVRRYLNKMCWPEEYIWVEQ